MTIPTNFRPMLACDYRKVITKPASVLYSEKLNGIRCVFFGGVAYSRTLKRMPNEEIQKIAIEHKYGMEGCDTEIISGDKYAVDVLHKSDSFCMTKNKIDSFTINIFDVYDPNLNWFDRTDKIKQLIENGCYPEHVRFLEHIPSSEIDLEVYKNKILNMGGEGVVIRNPYSTYKSGRSGIHNPELQKVKSYFDDEFMVVGYTQLETNKNEAFLNEVGYTKRSTSKIGKSKVEALGSIIVTKEGTCFSVGSGFTFEERIMLWKIRDTLLGKYAKIKYTSYSYKNVPLQPIFICFRNKIDM